jgi:hypothetical protein
MSSDEDDDLFHYTGVEGYKYQLARYIKRGEAEGVKRTEDDYLHELSERINRRNEERLVYEEKNNPYLRRIQENHASSPIPYDALTNKKWQREYDDVYRLVKRYGALSRYRLLSTGKISYPHVTEYAHHVRMMVLLLRWEKLPKELWMRVWDHFPKLSQVDFVRFVWYEHDIENERREEADMDAFYPSSDEDDYDGYCVEMRDHRWEVEDVYRGEDGKKRLVMKPCD